MYHDANIRPRYKETDQMGVIYHGNYFTYFEVGRTDYMRNLGFPYSEMEKRGIILPVTRCECRFIKPVMYDDPIWVRTRVGHLKGIRVEFHYQIIRQSDGEMLAEGQTHHAFVGRNMRPLRKSEIDPQFLETVKTFMEQPE